MIDILNIGGAPIFDDRITKIETHSYNPYANTTFEHSDEIRIPIQQQDLYTLPSESLLYVEGKLTDNGTPAAQLVNNCVAFMFDEIRYELNGVEVDRGRNVGITSTIKSYVSPGERGKKLANAGWYVTSNNFNFCVPLRMLLGFCEDYKRVVINARHELILIRSRDDNNSIVATGQSDNPKITLMKIQWRMPHVIVNDVNKLSLLRMLDSGRYLSVGFRSWDLYEFPLLQRTTEHSWAVKAATQLEKPRYVIFALQTARKNTATRDMSKFDNCNLSNVKLYLNSEFYPYDDMNLDFKNNRVAVLYDMYVNFRGAYYGNEQEEEAFLSLPNFLEYGPLVVLDCSRQNESIKSATVDVRIEFECRENVPDNTTAYCLIIHDRIVEYNPMTNIVRKII